MERIDGPGMVDPRDGRLSKRLVDYLQRQEGRLTTTVNLTTTINETVAASGNSGDALLAAMYGTNGVQVFGSIESGVEIRGPDLSSITAQQGPPGLDGESPEVWPMLPPVNPCAEFTARSLTIGVKTIPSGHGLYVIGPYEISAGAMLEVSAGAVLEVG